MPQEVKTITVTNFGGPLTRKDDGDIDSGLAKFDTSWGYDPYSKPGELTWFEQPTSILSLSADNGPVVAMKSRSESGENIVYAVARTTSSPKLYRIEVNDNSTSNPNFDTASVISTLTPLDSLFDADMVFYGSTEKIFFKGDGRVGKVNFNGSSPTSIAGATDFNGNGGTLFLGNIFFANNNNIAKIDSTELLVNSSVLSPALPKGLTVRDLDVTPDGNYLQITASRLSNQNQFNGAAIDVSSSNAVDSYKYYWNGIDSGATATETFEGLALTASQTFQGKNYGFGYDLNGAGIYDGSQKTITLSKSWSPQKNATFSIGNVLGFVTPEYEEANTRFTASIFFNGQYDEETPKGLFRLLRHPAQINDDIVSIPAALPVSNLLYVPRIYDYANNIGGRSKIYYSTVEENDDSPSGRLNKLWRFETKPTGQGSVVAGVYETQTQMFSKKMAVKEIRLYTEPLKANNDFIIDLIGSGGSVMASGSQRFVVGASSIATGADVVMWNPGIAPTYALGVRITNSSVTGSANWTAKKLEIDVVPGGK